MKTILASILLLVALAIAPVFASSSMWAARSAAPFRRVAGVNF
jgi:hypothetical protein